MKDTYRSNKKPSKKSRREKPRRSVTVLLVALLAAVCIGGMELAFCSLFAPELYHKITDPVVKPIAGAVQSIQAKIELRRFQHARDSAASQVSSGAGNYYVPKPVLYPEYVEIPTPTPVPTPPPVTQLVKDGSMEYLTGGSIPCVYYNQGDPAWRDKPFGSDPIGTYGCGPTAMSIVVSSLTGQTIDPAQMAEWAYGAGYWCSGSGSYLTIVEGTCKANSLACKLDKQCTAEGLTAHLSGGGYAIALVGPGIFTSSSGHFIVLHGAADGKLLIADPGSRENSQALWDPAVILKEAETSSGDGVAVWLISKPISTPESSTAP